MLGISFVVLLIMGFAIEGNLSFLFNDFWFTAGLLLLITLSLVDQPYFSKDSNIFINAITAGVSLLLIPLSERSYVYWVFFVLVAYLLISSFALMFLRNRRLSDERCGVQAVARINRQLGKPEVLFSALFLWGAARQYTINSNQFAILFLFWAVFLIAESQTFASTIQSMMSGKQIKNQGQVVGKIVASKSKNRFLIEVEKGSHLDLGHYVAFRDEATDKNHSGMVFSINNLKACRWAEAICFHSDQFEFEGLQPGLVYRSEILCGFKDGFVGITAAGTTVETLKFEYSGLSPIQVGQLIEMSIANRKVIYQVTDAAIRKEALQDANESESTIGEAIQLGTWNQDQGKFEHYGWVPDHSEVLHLAESPSMEVQVSNDEIQIGTIPGSSFPVIMNKEMAVTHHLAILGVTGTGKSHFARKLIRELADDAQRVIIVDLTGEYKTMFPDIDSIIDKERSQQAFNAIEMLATENAKFQSQRSASVIDSNEKILKKVFYDSIKEFLESDKEKSLLELPDISNKSSIFEYVRWFFWCLFETSKTKDNFGKRVCVVLEEAHTVVPEYNAMGANDNASRASVNSIAQIALQGRKYNIGLIVIAQRTANVSKTILTQCNSIIAFQEFDKTSTDFLSSYMSPAHLKALSTLEFRTGIAVGKAFKSTVPMIFEVPFHREEPYQEERQSEKQGFPLNNESKIV